ncbi:class E basic helix-loop-helix protein 41 [Boleophthalmus pectinirostris]|uniref:class E basic helix-loop-helix protein 41 n=1 Tax=Boleophthalmus pectinirostris TaxID=150288 RepID=UPI000A1C2F5B|nr:class E basic helix-loop-helix protein 41 [Boleophthalmus pectinirostris]
MDERIARLQDRQFMEHADFLGMDYPSLYMCKSKRGIKREDGGKDAYKLPHRLIEKKRRDRINECIGQLKDLLPEHLKLSTLGHLEKAVVLELTLKHLNALTAVTEQQHQKILALENGDRSIKPLHADLDAFQSGFQACAKEVLQYLAQFENWTTREQRCLQLINHLHKVLAQLQSGAPPLQHQLLSGGDAQQDAQKPGDGQANCVPVIQRTQGGELNENDTDTDSGYGGEADKSDKDKDCDKSRGSKPMKIKQEFGEERAPKKPKMNWPVTDPTRPELSLMNSLMGITSLGQQTPICMPFYFINPSAAASYMPFFDKSGSEKFMYPAAALASPFPWLYPAHASAAAAAAAAAFPGLSAHLAAAAQTKDSFRCDSDGSREADGDGSREVDAASPEEHEESPASESADGDAAETSAEKSPVHFPACQTD